MSLESLEDRLIERGLPADRDDHMEDDLRRMGFAAGWEQERSGIGEAVTFISCTILGAGR